MPDGRQSKVSTEGGNWEQYVFNFLKQSCSQNYPNLLVRREVDAKRDERIRKVLSIRVPQTDEMVWPDADIVVCHNSLDFVPIAIISCKVSLHGRLSESLFYATQMRMRRIRYVLATPDKGRQDSAEWESEWGTQESPTDNRILAYMFLEAVYVDNNPSYSLTGARTALGGIVRALTECPADLARWAEDIKFSIPYHGNILGNTA